MARALIGGLLLLVAAACSPAPVEPDPLTLTGPRTYTLLAWFDDETAPSLIARYRMDLGTRTVNGDVSWANGARTGAWIATADALYVAGPDGQVGSFPSGEPGRLLAAWPPLTADDPFALLDPSALAERLTDCTTLSAEPDLLWRHEDPLGAAGDLREETLTGGSLSGICGGLPLRGELWRDADGRTRLIGLALPGLRLEWNDLGAGPEPLLLAPAAAPLEDLARFLDLR